MKCSFRGLLALVLVFMVVFSSASIAENKVITKEEVLASVEMTAEAMKKDAPGTIAKINASEHPFVNKDNPSLYVFIYDGEVNMIAHPKSSLVGKNFKGKPDVKGKKFRDEIVSGAAANQSGWVDYSYQKPGEKGIFDKTAYYMSVKASDGKDYILVCGMYKEK